jgi:tetratricopeptide (TPR) repeat protein
VLGGDAVQRASAAAVAALTEPGAIVLRDDEWRDVERLAQGCSAVPLATAKGVVVLHGDLLSRSAPIKLTDRVREFDSRLRRRLEQLEDIDQALFSFLVPSVAAHLRTNDDAAGAGALRAVAAVTLRLAGLPCGEAHCDAVHAAVGVLQSFANHFGGSLMSLNARGDDLFALVVVGLPPVSVEAVSQTAANLAFELLGTLRRSVAKPFDVSAGVATGRIHCAALGCAGRRVWVLGGSVVADSELMAIAAAPRTVVADEATWAGLRGCVRTPSARPSTWTLSRRRDSIVEEQKMSTALVERMESEANAATLQALLDETARFAASGAARLVFVEGVGGVGKRRVMSSFLRALEAAGFDDDDKMPLLLSSHGDIAEVNTPFYVWRSILIELIEAMVGESGEKIHLSDVLQACPMLTTVIKDESSAVLRVLGTVLPVLATAATRAADDTIDEAVYRRAGRILLSLILDLMPDTSLVIVLGSCCWLDAHSWDLVASLHSSAAVMLVLFSRPPQARSPGVDKHRALLANPAAVVMKLSAWSREHLCKLVCAATNCAAVDDAVADFICDRADGNPFFATELALALLNSHRLQLRPLFGMPVRAPPAAHSLLMSADPETALSDAADGVEVEHRSVLCLAAPDALMSSALPFPTTLHGILQRRVDALSPTQQLVLRVAAAIGDVFELQLLCDIVPVKGGADARAIVGELVELGFFLPSKVSHKTIRVPGKVERPPVIVTNDGQLASVVDDTIVAVGDTIVAVHEASAVAAVAAAAAPAPAPARTVSEDFRSADGSDEVTLADSARSWISDGREDIAFDFSESSTASRGGHRLSPSSSSSLRGGRSFNSRVQIGFDAPPEQMRSSSSGSPSLSESEFSSSQSPRSWRGGRSGSPSSWASAGRSTPLLPLPPPPPPTPPPPPALRAVDEHRVLQFADLALHTSVYEMILPSQRRQLHVSIAEWYEKRRLDSADVYAVLLAHHYSAAERGVHVSDPQSAPLLQKAISCLEAAARLATTRSSQVAIDLYASLLRIWRERPGAVDTNSAIEWATMAAHAHARLGDLQRARELCQLAIDTGLFDNANASAMSRLYRRIVPERLRLMSRGSAPKQPPSDAVTKKNQLMISVLTTHAYLLSMAHDPVRACEAARQAVEIAEQLNDPLQLADSLGLLAVHRSNLGDVDGAIALRARAIVCVEALLEKQRGRLDDSSDGIDGHSVAAQLGRVTVTIGSSMLTCGYLSCAVDDLLALRSMTHLPDTPRCTVIMAWVTFLAGDFRESALYCERALVMAPKDRPVRRWTYLRSVCLALLGCPDVGMAVLSLEQKNDPLLFDLPTEFARVSAGEAPATPANAAMLTDRFYYLGPIALVCFYLAQYDACAAYLLIGAAHPIPAVGSMLHAVALCNLAEAAVLLAEHVVASPASCKLLTPAAAIAHAEFHVRRVSAAPQRALRGWQLMFEGMLALIRNKQSAALKLWTEAVAEVKRKIPKLPRIPEALASLLRERSAPSTTSLASLIESLDDVGDGDDDDDDDDDDDESGGVDKLSELHVRRSLSSLPSLRARSSSYNSAVPSIARRTVVLETDSTDDSSGSGRWAGVPGESDESDDERDGERERRTGDRQQFLLARLYDLIGRHMETRKSAQQATVHRRRVQYLAVAARLYESLNAAIYARNAREFLDNINNAGSTTGLSSAAEEFWRKSGRALGRTK